MSGPEDISAEERERRRLLAERIGTAPGVPTYRIGPAVTESQRETPSLRVTAFQDDAAARMRQERLEAMDAQLREDQEHLARISREEQEAADAGELY